MELFPLWKILLVAISVTKCNANLIASSEVQVCARTSMNSEPMYPNGEACSKKFVVSLAVQSGQGESGAVYASIKYVDEKTPGQQGHAVHKRQQLTKPFRIAVTKSDVYVAYPLKRMPQVVNNGPIETSFRWSMNVVEGAFRDLTDDGRCVREKLILCPGYRAEKGNGFCCEPDGNERWGRKFSYKRGNDTGRAVSPEWSRMNVMAICAHDDNLWWHVYDIGDPYLLYRINVTVQQLDYRKKETEETEQESDSDDNSSGEVWHTIGYATIGPEMIGDNTNRKKPGVTSGPEVKAEWQGDFAPTSNFPNLKTKHLLVPDDRYFSYSYYTRTNSKAMQKVQSSHDDYLLIDKHLFDMTGLTCNKIGVKATTIVTQANRCYQKKGSCFRFTPRTVLRTAKDMQAGGIKSHYLPSFYGDYRGFMQTTSGLNMLFRSDQVHQSLITLQFTAQSIVFVEHRSPGRIVEAIVEDFLALAGASSLSVTVQNTGTITSAYSVSIDDCTDGIIPISEKTKTISPRQQTIYIFEISSSLNIDYRHNCTVLLTNKDGKLLGSKVVNFNTTEGCVYCPDGQCDCECKPKALGNLTTGVGCTADRLNVIPLYDENFIVVPPCYYCWFTDTFKDPKKAAFTIMVALMALGMIKMLVCHCCCKTKDGRYIDVAGVILGTTNEDHTWKKQRSATLHFLLGMSFFLYLPLLPLVILFCSWRRRVKARKRLMKKAQRKKIRIVQKKRAALTAMKGLMIQEDLTIEDALKVMEHGQKAPDRLAPMLPPKILVVSSSSDTDKNDFNYTSSSEDIPENFLAAAKKKSPALLPPGKRAANVGKRGLVAGRAPKNRKGAQKRRAQLQPKKPNSLSKNPNVASKNIKGDKGVLGEKSLKQTAVRQGRKDESRTVDKRDKRRDKPLKNTPRKTKGKFESSGKAKSKGKLKTNNAKGRPSKGHSSGREDGGTGNKSRGDDAAIHKQGGEGHSHGGGGVNEHKDCESSHSIKISKQSKHSISLDSIRSLFSKSSHSSNTSKSTNSSIHSSKKGTDHDSHSIHSRHSSRSSNNTHSKSHSTQSESDKNSNLSQESEHSNSDSDTHSMLSDEDYSHKSDEYDQDDQYDKDDVDEEDETGEDKEDDESQHEDDEDEDEEDDDEDEHDEDDHDEDDHDEDEDEEDDDEDEHDEDEHDEDDHDEDEHDEDEHDEDEHDEDEHDEDEHDEDEHDDDHDKSTSDEDNYEHDEDEHEHDEDKHNSIEDDQHEDEDQDYHHAADHDSHDDYYDDYEHHDHQNYG